MGYITRYEVNEQGDLPVSYGRYARWQDVEDAMKEMQEEIDRLEDEVAKAESPCCDYDDGHEDGYAEGISVGSRIGVQEAIEALKNIANK